MWYVGDDDAGIEDSHLIHCEHEKISLSLDALEKGIPFETKCKDRTRGLALFGTVPPPKKISLEQVTQYAYCVAEVMRDLQPDGFQVYDIQDEKSRNGAERPFPFMETHDPRVFASILESIVPKSEPIVYRALSSGQTEEEFNAWITETIEQHKKTSIVLVGGSPQPNEKILTVSEATKLIKAQKSNSTIGGITIPERHRDKGDEPARMVDKIEKGMNFFTSQVVYNADNAIAMLRDYDEWTKANNKEPVRIVFTFAPFGSDNTVTFLSWLGVEVPEGTKKRVLLRPNLKARVEESAEICWENWRRILDAMKRLKIDVPIGFGVESVTKSKAESDVAVKLFKELREEMDNYYLSDRKSVV